MSIIHNALKKTQNSLSQNEPSIKKEVVSPSSIVEPKKKKSFNRIILGLLVIVVCIVLGQWALSFFQPKTKITTAVVATAQPPVEPKASVVEVPPAPTAPPAVAQTETVVPVTPPQTSDQTILALQGVFMTGNRYVALVNNQMCEVGDSVDGWQVTDINMDEVKLSDGTQTMTLKSHP